MAPAEPVTEGGRWEPDSRGFKAPPPRLRFAQAVLPQEDIGFSFPGGKVAPAEPVTKGGSGSLQQSPLCSEDSARAWLLSHGVKRSGGGWEGVVSNNGTLSKALARPEG